MTPKPGNVLAAFQNARKGKGSESPSRREANSLPKEHHNQMADFHARSAKHHDQEAEYAMAAGHEPDVEKHEAAQALHEDAGAAHEAAAEGEKGAGWKAQAASKGAARATQSAGSAGKISKTGSAEPAAPKPRAHPDAIDRLTEPKAWLAKQREAPGYRPAPGGDAPKPPRPYPDAAGKSFKPQSPEQYAKGVAAAESDKKRGEDIKKSDEHMDAAREARRVGNDTGYQNHMDAAASHDQAAWAHRENYHGKTGAGLHEKAKEASTDANKVSAAIETGVKGGQFVRTKGGGKRYTKK